LWCCLSGSLRLLLLFSKKCDQQSYLWECWTSNCLCHSRIVYPNMHQE
jgi:hypothetical protein